MSVLVRLLAALPEPARGRLAASAAVPAELARIEAWFAEASTTWPALQIEDGAFAAWVAERIAAADDPVQELAKLRAGDLFIACACAEGDDAAVAAIEAAFGDHVEQGLARIEADRERREELRQIVRQHVFVGDGVGAIARYSGHGPLGAWLRVTATRVALNAQRGRRMIQPIDDDDLAGLPERLRDPELDYLKQTYRDAFREAFQLAIAGLTPRERTLLRQAVIHGLTVREVARMYGVHHATVARWLTHARDALAGAVHRELGRRLRLAPDELASVLALIRSRIELSIGRVLAPSEE
jgi:RNA polymerase sigma-70 factor (ECF subfamily)